MFITRYRGISFRKERVHFLTILLFLIWTPMVFPQGIQVLKTNGLAAVISEGSGGGIKNGDFMLVKRLKNGSWKNITYAVVTAVRYNIAKIVVPKGAPQIDLKIGDSVEKIKLPARYNKKITSAAESKKKKRLPPNPPLPKSSNVVYLGPTAGVFVPLGDMKNSFQNNFGYGGIIGIRFRQYFDVSMRFFYTAKGNDWSFWNVQLLGRRYYGKIFLLDFGYGVCYPESKIGQASFSSGGEPIRLGFIGGFGFSLPVAFTTQFELGCLFQYYPNFGDKAGRFLTIQGRLVL